MSKSHRRMITRISAAVVLTASVATCAKSAIAAPLSSANIAELVTGATIHIDTPLGITLPMSFDADGTVRGSAGKLSFYMESETDQGRWWVQDNKLCQKWRRWFEAKANCLTLQRQGTKFAWARDDGKTGTASIVAKNNIVVAEKSEPIPRAHSLGGPATETAPQIPSIGAGTVPVIPKGRQVMAMPAQPLATSPKMTPSTPKLAAKPAPQPAAPPVTHSVSVATVAPEQLVTRGITYRVVNVPSHDTLNVRTEPNASAQVVGTVPPSGRGLVMIGDCNGQWCPMSHAGKSGWVNRLFLALEPMAQASIR